MYKTKQNYSINPVKSFLIGAAMGLATLFGCHEPDEPVTPPTPQPDPTDTIVIPTKEKTFDIDFNTDDITPMDSIKEYATNPEYKYVFINIMNKGSPLPYGQEGCPCGGFPTRAFKRARDTLQTRLDINPSKVRGSGTIIVDRTLSDDAAPGELGIHRSDSTWYADNGWRVAYRQITMGK